MLMGHALGNQKSSFRESSNLRIRSNNTRIYRAGILSAFALFLLTINLLFPISVDTNSAEGAALPSTTELAINTDYSSANLDFTTISSTGTFASSSAEDIAKFTVTTNNYTGYTLTLAGNDDTGQLNNISAGAALDSIATSGIESSSFSTNEWGYLPSKYNSETNTTKYYSAPTTSDADTLDVTNAANASNTPNEYTISLGAKVDYSKPAGTYTNTFSVIAIANPISYTINYLDNSGDTNVTNLPSPQAAETTATTVTLAPYGSTTPDPEDVPLRPDHEFLGWCSVPTTKNGTMCSGDILNTGDTIEIDQTKENTTNLYAYWLSTKSNYIQDYTKTTCSTEAVDSPITLVDKRDNKEYTVRYINGNCWMTQNLAYMGDTVGSSSTATTWYLKSTTSNVSADKTMTMADLTSGNSYADAKYHLATSDQVPSGADFTATDIGVWYNYAAVSAMNIATDSNSTQASESVCPAGWRLPTNVEQVTIGNSSTTYASAFSPVYSGRYGNGSPYNLGSYGHWWSSTARNGTDRYNMNYYSGSLYSGDGSDRGYGLSVRCIRVPYSTTITFDGNGATGGEMDEQVISGDSAPSGILAANGYTRTGYVFTGWNTQANGSGTSYADNGTYTAASTSETSRTLYAQWAESGGYIQDYTKSTCQANASSAPVYLTDKRDNKLYRARYINGNCWMVDNLRYVGDTGSSSGSMVMKSATSNIDTDKTIAYNDLTFGDNQNDPRLHVSTNTSYGVYYNYAAASATYVTDSQQSSTEATYSVCPAGWRLPTHSEQTTIGSSSGSSTYVSTWLPVYGGHYSNGALLNESSRGFWWSSTAFNSTDRYSMLYDSGNLYSTNGGNRRYSGFYVRCIAMSDIERGMTMQEIGRMSSTDYTTLFNSMEDGKSYSTTDERDGNSYTIAKINGNLWMTSNLRFVGKTGDPAGTMTLDSTTSNVAATYTESNPQTIAYSDLTSGNSYDEARLHVSTDTSYGVYYNYVAASAMTITGSSNTTDATYDICPKGWRLPTNTEQKTISNYSSTYVSTWLPVYAGRYNSGSLVNEGYGYWWSSTSYDSSSRYSMYYSYGLLSFGTNIPRDNGIYVRCIRPNSNLGCFIAGTAITTTMDGATKPIEEIQVGDEIVSYDPNTNEYYMTEVVGKVVHDGEERSTYLADMTLDDNTVLTMTTNHPILTKDGYKALNNEEYPVLTENDIVVTTTGERTIKSIATRHTEPAVVYNLTVKGRSGDTDDGLTHSYIANGVVVHNVITTSGS